MGRKPNAPEVSDEDLADAAMEPLPERDQAAELEAARLRVKLEALQAENDALKARLEPDEPDDGDGKYVNAKRLKHPHDIERFWRLGMLSPKDVKRFQEDGQLPVPKAEG